MTKSYQSFFSKTLSLILLILLIIYWFPVLWMFLTSVRNVVDTLSWPPVFLFKPTGEHYYKVIYESGFLKAFINSLIVGIGSTGVALLFGIPAAYGIAQLKIKKRESLAFYIISTKFTPPIVVLFAYFVIFSRLGLLNSRFTLGLLHVSLNLPLTIWLLRGFFQGIPKEIEEAAELDGCSRLGGMLRIGIPIVLPGIIITSVLSFMFSWMEFIFAATITGQDSSTVPVLAYRWMSYTQIDWGSLAATGVLYAIPMFILTFLVRDHLVKGLTFGLYK